jgi:glycolate oxidase FAD binding subunit
MLEQFRARILERRPLRIRGGGSKDFYGQALAGGILDTRGYSGIVDYEPTELVITARCGTPLAEIESALAARRQMLAFEPPSFDAGATIGGVIAAGLSGPRRASVGAVRDFVLGVKIIDGEGRLLRFGGQVMKNVAGFDVARLMAGSLGTLGLIVEVSLKVLPLPAAGATLRFELPQQGAQGAIELMNRWASQPLPVSATCWHDDVLTLRLSGARAAVDAAAANLGGERLGEAEAAAFWGDLREQRHPFFAGHGDDGALWRLSVPSTAPALSVLGPTLIEWGGAQRWVRGDVDARAAATAAGGHATLFRGGDAQARRSRGAFQPLEPVLERIHRDLKRAFDPHGVFNPGRLYPDF